MTEAEEPFMAKNEYARRHMRRFVAYSGLFLAALAVVQVVVLPACEDLYTGFGGPLPRITLVTLAALNNYGYFFLMAAALAVAAIAGLLSRVPSDSPLRRYAWLFPAAGLIVVFLLLAALVTPVF